MSSSSDQGWHVQTVDDAIAEYIRQTELGERFDRQAWLAKYPQWADELREFIVSHDKMQSFAGEMRRRRQSAAATSPFGTEIKYVGEYELLDQLGQGGMGIVFKARQASLDRLVALKMLLDDSRDRDRFRAEAEAAAALEHPNLVRIYEVGDHEGWPYYTMQFIDGHDLREEVERHSVDRSSGSKRGLTLSGEPKHTSTIDPPPKSQTPFDTTPKRIAEIVAKLAAAVQYAHDRGVLHRDLKPANVLIDKLGEPHITDFGLAKFVADVAQITQTQSGVVLGTPSYMAPEQAAGDTTQVTVGTDVYGLGTILYALLAGRAPFTGENSLAVLRQVERDAPAPIRSIHGNVPADLETICLKCLEKLPRDRYRSAEALGEDLHRFVAGEPIQARPVGALERSWRWCLRNPAVSGLAALLLLLLVGSAVGGMWMARNERLAYQAAEASRVREAEARENVEESLIDSFVAHGRSAHRRSNSAESLLWHATAADMARSSDQREMANVRLSVRNFKVATPVRAGLFAGEFVSQLEFHPHSRYLLVGDRAGTIVCWDVLNDTPWQPLSHQQTITAAHWSADGRWLVMGSDTGQVSLVELNTGESELVGRLDGAVVEIALDENALHIVACTVEEVALYVKSRTALAAVEDAGAGLGTGASAHTAHESGKRWSTDEGNVVHVAINPSGDHILVQTDNDQAHAFKSSEWPEPQLEALVHEYQPYRPDRPHPVRPHLVDGNIMVYANKNVEVFDVVTGELINRQVIGDSRLLLVDHKRQQLLNGGDRRARLRALDGSYSSRAFNHRGLVVDGDFHPSRDVVAVGSWDRRVIVWHARSALRANLLPHQGRVTRVRFSPTGALIATAQDDGLVRIWRAVERSSDSWRGLTVPDGGSRALLLDDGLLFTAGTSRDSAITDLQLINPYASEPVGAAVALEGTLVEAACLDGGQSVFALVRRAPEVTELISASLETAGVQKRVAIDDTSERLLFAANRIAVLTSEGAIEFYDEALKPLRSRTTLAAVGGTRQADSTGAAAQTPDGLGPRLIVEPGCDEPMRRNATRIAAGYGSLAAVINVSSGSIADSVEFDSNISAISLSLDERLAAAGTDKGHIRIWSLDQNRTFDTRVSVPGYVYTVRFSPDGRKLLVAAADGARMLDTATGKLVGRLVSHENDVFDAMFSDNGKFFYTLGDNGLITVSSATDGSFIRHYIAVTGDRATRPQDRRLWLSRSPDRRRILVCGLARRASVHNIAPFEHPVPAIDTRRQRALSELIANQFVADGKLQSITTKQWLDRWDAYCRQYGTPSLNLATPDALRWFDQRVSAESY